MKQIKGDYDVYLGNYQQQMSRRGQAIDPQKRYLNNLMKKHTSSLCRVQQAVQSQTLKLTEDIDKGKYNIHQAEIHLLRKRILSQQPSTLNLKDMLQLKRNLQSKLVTLQNNLGQLNNPKQSLNEAEPEQQSDLIKHMISINKKLLMKKIEKRQQQGHRSQRSKEEDYGKPEDMKQMRPVQLKIYSRVLDSLVQNKPMYEESSQKLELGSLEKKKKRLAQIRSLKQPISQKILLSEPKQKIEALKERKLVKRPARFNTEIDIFNHPEDNSLSWNKKLPSSQTIEKVNKGSLSEVSLTKEKVSQRIKFIRQNTKTQVNLQVPEQQIYMGGIISGALTSEYKQEEIHQINSARQKEKTNHKIDKQVFKLFEQTRLKDQPTRGSDKDSSFDDIRFNRPNLKIDILN